jgi:hypothetical protein
LFEHYNADRTREAFNDVRSQPGFPILMNNSHPIVEDIVRLGLVPAPTVVGADRQERAFAIMLYGLDSIYLTSKKQVLDRALALIACVRCGEVSGGLTPIRMPDKLLAALMDQHFILYLQTSLGFTSLHCGKLVKHLMLWASPDLSVD